ncbi:MAG: cyclic nucleotide-binding domain-containing protein [Gammaproteobacteria bacterium]|nr:cyclic nucleotide-binding domain-containing protein [Pseudomonadales bacterium]MCP5348730.1 cyclic nucleotide-binding domain-containing protein [Pseudomonadales bacterium]
MQTSRLEQTMNPAPVCDEQGASNILGILSNAELLRLGVAKRREYACGETILVEGSIGRTLFLIEHGTLRILPRVELDNQRRIQPGLCDLGPGEVFGELSLFEPVPRSATVMAVESCRLLEIDAAALTEYFDHNPAAGYLVVKELFGVLTKRLRQADRRFGQLLAWGLKAHRIDRHL